MRKIAHCIHHTHWDLIWYFTVQDATVQFCYNMKELLRAFRSGRVKNFFFDGQMAPIDEYLLLHPEDKEYITELMTQGKLVAGPFNSQLDCYISSGESVINNLRLGINRAKALGCESKVAYLPDSFGHSYDFPKIFNQYGIKDFVITRGVGDDYGLGSEFFMQSNDGSELLVCTMIAGYGYGCYGFKDGTLFSESAVDYNKISVHQLIDRLLSYSTVENEFVFPLGFDQNPAMLDIEEKIEKYNKTNDQITFKSTTWQDFCNHVREKGKGLKTHKGELFSTQYHRVHKSMFSARADIKGLQDACERILTFELQPMLVILDSLGIEYDHGMIDSCWERLVKCQTHSSATLTDETNNYILRETTNVYNQLNSHKFYLMKLMSISLKEKNDSDYPLIVFNTLPYKRNIVLKERVLTKSPYFTVSYNNQQLNYTLLSSTKKNCGVLRKSMELVDESKFYYDSEILVEVKDVDGFSYRVLDINDSDVPVAVQMSSVGIKWIENDRYRIYKDVDGITIKDKKFNVLHKQAIYIEESGDEGDSFDYSYPDHDMLIKDDFSLSDVEYKQSVEQSVMTIKGSVKVPFNLKSRELSERNSEITYNIEVVLDNHETIQIKGYIDNKAEAHRVRLVFTGTGNNQYSYAGTQFGFIKRETHPEALEYWREKNWFEEPSPTWPLLNHVSTVNDEVLSVFTRSSKEYELINENYKDIAITIFRSYGAMGYPDLNRRPGRPSGLDYMIFDTPECQMIKKNYFDLALSYSDKYDANKIMKQYTEFACSNSVFEKQPFDKSINPITYFPTNPLDYKLPREYTLMSLENGFGSFGTLVKEDNGEGYLLRLFNSENYEEKAGKINDVNVYVTGKVDLEGKEIAKVSNDLPDYKVGELFNIRMIKKGGE
ncbi:MAG: glycoside hydrolase family 38 C-terminal domain-containing protein [Erysipelotrichaceae bacterium]|nr:glycoside hydrolase family 38 C-terminal domain-containing protein [Erysipelotrichaceae bacterium]